LPLPIDATVTNINGEYSFTINTNNVDPTDILFVRIFARSSLNTITGLGASYDISIVDNTNSDELYYSDQTQASDNYVNSPIRDFNIDSGWTGTSYGPNRNAAPFAILDSMFQATNRFINVDPKIQFELLQVNWSSSNTDSGPNAGETVANARMNGRIGTSFYSGSDSSLDPGEIYVLGDAATDTDEYDEHVIIHEWGHYFEDRLSRSDSIGGSHGIGDRLDLRLAFGEGFGNAYK